MKYPNYCKCISRRLIATIERKQISLGMRRPTLVSRGTLGYRNKVRFFKNIVISIIDLFHCILLSYFHHRHFLDFFKKN